MDRWTDKQIQTQQSWAIWVRIDWITPFSVSRLPPQIIPLASQPRQTYKNIRGWKCPCWSQIPPYCLGVKSVNNMEIFNSCNRACTHIHRCAWMGPVALQTPQVPLNFQEFTVSIPDYALLTSSDHWMSSTCTENCRKPRPAVLEFMKSKPVGINHRRTHVPPVSGWGKHCMVFVFFQIHIIECCLTLSTWTEQTLPQKFFFFLKNNSPFCVVFHFKN